MVRRIEAPQVMRFSAPNTISSRPAETYGTLAISPDGREIVYSADTGQSKMLFRRPIDHFEATPIAGSDGGVQPFFSPDAKWVGFFARQKLSGRLVLMNRRGEREPAMLPDAHFVHPRFSPDGTSLAGERDFSIWTIDLLRGTSTRVATGARMGWPVWSADGKRIFYASERSGPWQIWSRAADGSDEERQISKTAGYSATPSAVSPDGKELLVHADHKDSGTDIEIMDGSGTMRLLVRSDADDNCGTYSPDGRWIAYWSDESGRNEVYVRPRSGASGRWQISNQGGTEPRSVLDDEIAYLNGTKIMTVPVKTSPVFTAGTPRLLLDANASDFDLARDGRVLIVVNWFEEIRRR